MNTKKLLPILLVILLALVLVFKLKPASREKQDDSKIQNQEEISQVLNIGAVFDFKNNEDSTALIYDTLVRIEPSYEIIPSLAQSWEVNEDYTEYTFKLKEGVVFSDGSPLTLADFEESLNLRPKALYLSFVYKLENVEFSEDGLLKVSFNSPHINFLIELAKLGIVKAGTLDEEGNIKDYIGTGPFVLTEYEPQVSAKLIKNPLHHKSDDYALEEVNWIVIPEAQSRKLALASGQVDVIGISEGSPTISLAMSHEMKKDDSWGFVEQNKEYYTIVKGLSLNWKTGPLSDLTLRRALMYAVDREAFNQLVLFGEGQPCGHLFNPLFIDGPKNLEPFAYDLDKARDILKEGGYKLEDGKLTKDGKPVVLKQIIVSDEESTDIAVFIQNALKEIGIEVVIEGFEGRLIAEPLINGDYDIGLNFGWFEPLISSMMFGGIETDFAQCGFAYGANEQAIEAGTRLMASKNEDELKEAAQAYWEAQYEECVYLPLYSSGMVAFYNKSFEGFYFPGWVSDIDLSGVRKTS